MCTHKKRRLPICYSSRWRELLKKIEQWGEDENWLRPKENKIVIQKDTDITQQNITKYFFLLIAINFDCSCVMFLFLTIKTK